MHSRLSNEEIINNISRFVNETIILPAASYDYKQALRLLLNGYNTYEEVINWYNNQDNVKDGVNQLDTLFRQAFNGGEKK